MRTQNFLCPRRTWSIIFCGPGSTDYTCQNGSNLKRWLSDIIWNVRRKVRICSFLCSTQSFGHFPELQKLQILKLFEHYSNTTWVCTYRISVISEIGNLHDRYNVERKILPGMARYVLPGLHGRLCFWKTVFLHPWEVVVMKGSCWANCSCLPQVWPCRRMWSGNLAGPKMGKDFRGLEKFLRRLLKRKQPPPPSPTSASSLSSWPTTPAAATTKTTATTTSKSRDERSAEIGTMNLST